MRLLKNNEELLIETGGYSKDFTCHCGLVPGGHIHLSKVVEKTKPLVKVSVMREER